MSANLIPADILCYKLIQKHDNLSTEEWNYVTKLLRKYSSA